MSGVDDGVREWLRPPGGGRAVKGWREVIPINEGQHLDILSVLSHKRFWNRFSTRFARTWV
ncbi:hypothetical protein GCM10010185_08360 [Saccharothrix coeruleofusca]|uniref:Uncharacterized protein n=1 Tax=Saccharothrix coeruleofusca TaxID=33919 RepID=A0A918AHZ1_9PSEU|nr:hypothetical protein GCM10010185_08360 [Saccharothrix coeruleofusca]